MKQTSRFAAVACLLVAALAGSGAVRAGDDAIFGQGFENEFFAATNDAEAARFLNQATFGAVRSDIGAVRGSGYEAFIDAQFARAPTLARPFLEARAATEHAANRNISRDDRIHRWFDTAVTAPDQLRQRVAYALSQIIVVSDMNDALRDEPIRMAEWNDMLVRHAFGNYRDLLREASFSPMMGQYLTHLRNRKFELTPRCRPNGNPTGAPTDCNNATTAPFIIATSTDPNNPSYAAGNNGAEPDENYAREIMQLFSIGLVTRDMDYFTVLDDGLGNPLPTYDQQMIRTLSRAFTGLSFACSGNRTVNGINVNRSCGTGCTGLACRFTNTSQLFFNDPPRASRPDTQTSSIVHPDWYEPMVCYPRYNDVGRDRRRFQLPGESRTNPVDTTIEAGVVIPAGTPDADKVMMLSGVNTLTLEEVSPGANKAAALNCETTAAGDTATHQACVTYCEDNVRAAVDMLFNHPNTAPMVARQLIQQFTNHNPSGAYVRRVACAFEGASADPTACAGALTTNARGDLRATIKAVLLDAEARRAPVGQDGRVREPLMKLVQVWRNFGAVSGDSRRWGLTSPENEYFQRPLGAPSVFNFFLPDYTQAGPITEAGLVSPPLQIVNENSLVRAANDLYAKVCSGYGSNNCNGAFATNPPTDRAYIPPASLDALPGMACATDVVNECIGATAATSGNVQLIEELNLRMLDGQMSGSFAANTTSCNGHTGMKGTLLNLLQCGLAGTLGSTGANAARDARRRKALYLIHLIAISPEFAHQR